MSKADFKQAVQDDDIQSFNKQHCSFKEAPKHVAEKTKLVKCYLVARFVLGATAMFTVNLFKLILQSYFDDKDIQKPYWKGEEDGEKRRPVKHYNTLKERASYEHGRQNGENNL